MCFELLFAFHAHGSVRLGPLCMICSCGSVVDASSLASVGTVSSTQEVFLSLSLSLAFSISLSLWALS